MTLPAAAPRITLWTVDLAQPLAPGPLLQAPIIFARVGVEAAEELARAMNHDHPGVIRQRFAQERHCYIGRLVGEVAVYGWITFDQEEIGEVSLTMRLRAGEAYIWHCATLPAYRGQRFYAALLVWMLRALQQQGLHRAWIGTDGHNRPAQNSVAQAGFQPVCDIFLDPTGAAPRALLRGQPTLVPYLLRGALALLPLETTYVKPYGQPE